MRSSSSLFASCLPWLRVNNARGATHHGHVERHEGEEKQWHSPAKGHHSLGISCDGLARKFLGNRRANARVKHAARTERGAQEA